MGKALFSLSEEDPTFQVRTDEDTGQTVISGMGELHLEVHRRPHAPRVQRGRHRRQAPGRLPRDDHPDRHQAHLHPQEADRRQGPVRRGHHRPRADRPRWWLRVRRQDHRRPRPEGVHPVRGRRHPAVPRRGRAGRLPARSTCAPSSPTASTTTSTPPRWPSRSPARWPSRRPSARRSPCCSNRSCRSRSSRPTSTWATSSATSTHVVVRSVAWTSAATARSCGPRCRSSEMFGYSTDLRSRTQGRASYSMHFGSYQQTPASVQEEIVARVRGD